MADLSTHPDPEELKDEKPDYSKDVSGSGHPDLPPQTGDPEDLPTEGTHKAVVHLDEEAVRKAEREGKGF
ncbi:MAG TPA: hypothetical protein VD962_09415 [Rubricoccaceae bacterium]|nr:hypothetical protein [Rubricoccaceae bacterium]